MLLFTKNENPNVTIRKNSNGNFVLQKIEMSQHTVTRRALVFFSVLAIGMENLGIFFLTGE